MSSGEHSSAVCCFKRSGNWEKVIEASIISGCWIEFIEAIRRNSAISVNSQIESMINTFKSQKENKGSHSIL